MEDGKAVVIMYSGGIDEKTKKTLLERNLPTGQTWVKGDAFRDFALSQEASHPDQKEPVQKEIQESEFFQTADGSLWAVYNPPEKNLLVGTPEGFKELASLAESKKGF